MQITAANDEPGSPRPRPMQRLARLKRMIDALEHGPEGRTACAAILREIEALHPGLIDREAARILSRRLGLRQVADDGPPA
jgi:hypothetical protein